VRDFEFQPNSLQAQPTISESGLQTLDASLPESSSSPLTRRVVYDRLHYLLQHILSLIPTLPSTLEPLLVRNFPHKRQNQVAQATYIRNLLTLTEYCPELADRLLATIVDRAIQIDVSHILFCFKLVVEVRVWMLG
jgi:RNA polymerase I-specific transcription initiation factor RRN3